MSNAFKKASEIEKLAEADVLPFMENAYPQCTYYPTRHHLLIQKTCGDFLARHRRDFAEYVELKAEEANLYGNLFLETWSNKSRRTPGWMLTCTADWLWYYFVNNRELYLVPFANLTEWAKQRMFDFPEKPQGKYAQLNDTWGRCVPISVLLNEIKTFTGPFDPLQRNGSRRKRTG